MKLLILFMSFVLISCDTKIQNLFVQVDMSFEHDQGKFLPEKNDKISIAGTFNNWNFDEFVLEDPDSNWIYTILLPIQKINIDTLFFNFKITNNSRTASTGLESIPERRISLSTLKNENPVLRYNLIFGDVPIIDLTFTVGTSNQQLLGFFKPELGDKIMISGEFCNWCHEGIFLEDEDNDKIYTLTIPLRVSLNKPFYYKYRIIPNRKIIIPYDGWEDLEYREFLPTIGNYTVPYSEFNNVRRIARFKVNSKKFTDIKKFIPLKGDILQIKLILDDKESLTNPLTQISKTEWEISMMIPLNVEKIEWQLVKNFSDALTEFKVIQVPLDGKIFYYN